MVERYGLIQPTIDNGGAIVSALRIRICHGSILQLNKRTTQSPSEFPILISELMNFNLFRYLHQNFKFSNQIHRSTNYLEKIRMKCLDFVRSLRCVKSVINHFHGANGNNYHFKHLALWRLGSQSQSDHHLAVVRWGNCKSFTISRRAILVPTSLRIGNDSFSMERSGSQRYDFSKNGIFSQKQTSQRRSRKSHKRIKAQKVIF